MPDPSLISEAEPLHIDHPIHPGWVLAGLGILESKDSLQRRALEARYGNSKEQLEEMIRGIGMLSIQIDSKRAAHESANLLKLQVATQGVVSEQELGNYRLLAGRPEKIGEYILWFDKVATAAYAHLDHLQADKPEEFAEVASKVGGAKRLSEIVLDIGGNRLAGYWDNTRVLKSWAEGIGPAIAAIEPQAHTERCTTPAEQMWGYKLYRRFDTKDNGTTTQDFASATIRRRRREAIIRVPKLRQLLIVKESTGWLHVPNIENARVRDFISYKLHNWDEGNDGFEDSPVAKEAGKRFELEIERRGTGGEFSPLHDHYYVIASAMMPVVG